MRLTLVSAWTRATASEMDRPWACSDSSKSHRGAVADRPGPRHRTRSGEQRLDQGGLPGAARTHQHHVADPVGLLASRSWPLLSGCLSSPPCRHLARAGRPTSQGLRLRGNTRDGRRKGSRRVPAPRESLPRHTGAERDVSGRARAPVCVVPGSLRQWGPPVSRTEDPLLHGVSKGSASTSTPSEIDIRRIPRETPPVLCFPSSPRCKAGSRGWAEQWPHGRTGSSRPRAPGPVHRQYGRDAEGGARFDVLDPADGRSSPTSRTARPATRCGPSTRPRAPADWARTPPRGNAARSCAAPSRWSPPAPTTSPR